MLQSDQKELKKTLTIKNITINNIAGCYVNTQKKIQCRFNQNFLSMDEEEIFKYLELLKKMFGCKVDDTLQSLRINNDENKKMLTGLLASELSQETLTNVLYERIIETYDYIDEYCIFLFSSAYDIPVKGTDRLSQDESDEVYSAIYGLICPLEMSKPGLSYQLDTNKIANRKRDKVVSNPTIGFIYPDFHDRCPESDNVVFAMCDKKSLHSEFAENVLGCTKEMTAKEQKEVFSNALADIITNENIETVSAIHDELTGIIEDAKEENITPTVPVTRVKEVLINNGIDEEKASEFVQNYKEIVPDEKAEIRLDNVTETKKKTYKTPDITINVAPDKRHLVKTESRDGKEYIVISLESTVEINGINSSIK